jgi:hypothetical protein
MDEKLEKSLRARWNVLEERSIQITKMIDELDEIEEEFDEINLKTTTVYIVLQEKLLNLVKEQRFIESLWN